MRRRYLTALLILILSIFAWTAYKHFVPKPRIPVLTYHHLDQEINDSVTIDPDDFRKQMLSLKNAGYTFLTAQDLAAILHQEKALPKKPILITFDDGYLSNYEYAYPILKELGLKATIFVVANECGKTPGVLPHFSWQQAKEMYDFGVMDIQSHSFNSHFNTFQMDRKGELRPQPALTSRLVINGKLETPRQYKTRVTLDFLGSKQVIEKNVGNKVVALAYPFGAHSMIVRYLAKEAGFEVAFTARDGINFLSDNPYRLKRINVFGTYTDEKLLTFLHDPDKIPKVPHQTVKSIKQELAPVLLALYQFFEYMIVRIS